MGGWVVAFRPKESRVQASLTTGSGWSLRAKGGLVPCWENAHNRPQFEFPLLICLSVAPISFLTNVLFSSR